MIIFKYSKGIFRELEQNYIFAFLVAKLLYDCEMSMVILSYFYINIKIVVFK